MITCIGEILLDVIVDQDNKIFEENIGGAPYNLFKGILNLGGSTSFYGSIGDDRRGREILDSINNEICHLHVLKDRETSIAEVKLDKKGERSFTFKREKGTDYIFHIDNLDEVIKNSSIIHLGSLPISMKEGREFYDVILDKCKLYKKPISFDVNYREDIFNNDLEIYQKYIDASSILKLSKEEYIMFFAENIDNLRRNYIKNSSKKVYISLGSEGSMFIDRNESIYQKSIEVTPVDTTGAGDAFFASVLYKFYELKCDDQVEILKFSNVCGALSTLKKGGSSSFPNKKEIEMRLKEL